MTAGLHRDFLDLGLRNSLVHPGEARMLGAPVDLSSDHRRRLRRRRRRRPHLALAELLPQRPAVRRAHPLRAVHQRAHRRHRQPAHQRARRATRSPQDLGPRRTSGSGPPRRPAGRGGRTSSPGWRQRSGPERAAPDRARPCRAAAAGPGSRHATSSIDDRIRLLAGPHGRGRWAAAAGRRPVRRSRSHTAAAAERDRGRARGASTRSSTPSTRPSR